MTSSTLTTPSNVNTAVQSAEIVVSTGNFSLTRSDRCDACDAQAYVRVVFPANTELTLCNHHYRKSAEKLRATAKTIYDESVQLDGNRRSAGNGAFA